MGKLGAFVPNLPFTFKHRKSMNFKNEKKGKYAVITLLSDRLDNQTTAELKSELVLLAGENFHSMLLDFSGCAYCDTSVLSAVLIAHRLCKDGKLVIVNTNASVNSVLSIQRFDPQLDIVPTLAEGVEEIEKQ